MKVVRVLNQAEGIKFGFGERDVVVSESMAIADAERIQGDYPGVYVAVVEVVDEPAGAAAKAATRGKQ
ncbi:hypothetical protein [Spirosoma foliorum]|uniref:Uncharacterized protein n=1 Tax=Spirosoma foliorum TaxID=2710596 RepID=A0A7G5GYZ6_9BACT|nr:hypothetical protein [Spirosoma foliorum]QMW04088.1 hypothetical protein H3H32_03775 [Spirosoma foliorum]